LTSMPPAFDRLSAALANRYLIERELGRGGMATVYLARDLKHARLVALKVLRPELAAAVGPQRFLREIQVAAAFNHPHILALHDSGTAEGLLYYVMPYVEGESLRQRLTRERQLPVDEALRIARDVLSALDFAHQRGVVHRDIKPENILLGTEQALVADFGIARALDAAGAEKLTETGLALGTPHYMSPEQAASDGGLDGRSDLYSLGCVLYEMLAGEPPFTGPTAQAIMARHAVDPVAPLRTVRNTVPEPVERAIERVLAKVPADRFKTGAEFAAALAAPVGAREANIRHHLGTRRALGWAVALGVLILAGAGTYALARRGPKVLSSASVVAVLPPTPSTADTGLTRLGRDLVLTLSANLDGVGDIRTIDPHMVLAQTRDSSAAAELERGLTLGRRLGAGSVTHGSLARVGSNVRLDLGLFPTGDASHPPVPIARVSVTISPDSLAPLTDSVTHALLRQVWRRGEAPTPSIDAALKTRSAGALRQFLEGERAMLQSHWAEAAKAYERTIEADSTFWLAYARHGYARRWADQPQDSAIDAAAAAHRSALPELDRLIVESGRLSWGRDSVSAGLRLAGAITDRFPDNWFGWMNRADMLVHLGPHLGLTRRDAIGALERTVELAPDFVPAWEHLAWMYLQEHDTVGTARAIEALTRLNAAEGLSEGCFGCNYPQQVRLLAHADHLGRADYRALVDSVVRDVSHHFWALPVLPLWYGRQQTQIEVNRRVLVATSSVSNPEAEWALRYQIIRAWAARGAWDSALVAMNQYTGTSSDPTFLLINYRLATAGVLVDAINPATAVRWGKAARSAIPPGSPDRADLAWLDGVIAARQGHPSQLDSARASLRQAGSGAALLEQSLAGFALALKGDTRRAGQALATLEWQLAEHPIFHSPRETWLMAFDRFAAARWLLEAGDTAQAARLLTWHEAVDASSIAAVLAPLIYLERARIEEARGELALAQQHYEQFLRRYDMPGARHRHLVEQTRVAEARLAGRLRVTGQD
jgi:eukaryotic-like serine/threonine-protein kinase